VFYSRLKGRTEAELKTLGFADLSLYRPGMIVAERANRRWAESMVFPLLPVVDKLLMGNAARYRSIPVETLARAIAAFSHTQGSGNRVLYWQEMVSV
jgi:uncharacterized protein YbjT (DUF2867 family)